MDMAKREENPVWAVGEKEIQMLLRIVGIVLELEEEM
jgi:hypothetical protein